MPITIVATAGSASANSFVTAAEMTAYCDARLNATAWTAADDQLPALVEATRDLSHLAYIGTRVDSTQALSWPRGYAVDPDAPLDPTALNPDYPYFAEDAIPQRIKDATCELALQYLKAGTTDLAGADALSGVIEKTVDVITTRWASATARAQGLARFPRVMTLIAPLLNAAAGGLQLART